jgi:SOS-response transcriptional repressor LexA
MNDNQPKTVRPTKKQQELLVFIESFIAGHGYSPSYREIMNGLNYNSVATVALHVENLIRRGHLQKRDHSARSLEVVHAVKPTEISTNQVRPDQEKWLVNKVEHFFHEAEQLSQPSAIQIDQLYVLIGALKVLGLDGAAQSFSGRLSKLRQAVSGQ